MKRFKLLFASLLVGGLIGGLAVYPASRGLRAASGDALIGGTREICEAIIANEETRWENVRQRYFAGSAPFSAASLPPTSRRLAGTRNGDAESGAETCDALSAAHREAFHFHPGDTIVDLQRNAEGQAGDHSLAAVAARVRTRDGERTITVRWARDGSGPWHPEDIVSAPLAGESGEQASPRRHGGTEKSTRR